MPRKKKPHQRSLVCEGACNPGIGDLDTEVRRAREMVGLLPGEPLNILPLVARLGALRHTLHSPANNDETLYKCDSCGARRLYGGNHSIVLAAIADAAEV